MHPFSCHLRWSHVVDVRLSHSLAQESGFVRLEGLRPVQGRPAAAAAAALLEDAHGTPAGNAAPPWLGAPASNIHRAVDTCPAGMSSAALTWLGSGAEAMALGCESDDAWTSACRSPRGRKHSRFAFAQPPNHEAICQPTVTPRGPQATTRVGLVQAHDAGRIGPMGPPSKGKPFRKLVFRTSLADT
jgi:hypothetical protein